MQRAHQASQAWRTVPLAERCEIVRQYGKLVEGKRDEITDLIIREVGKLPWDAAGEVAASIAKVELSINALKSRRDQQINEVENMRRVVRFQPLGVTLVLGPFNFPLHLPGGQIIPSLLAGNSVVFKPSDQATAVGQWMLHTWREAGLPEETLQMIVGGVDVATAAIDAPELAAVFLTGGRTAGRAVHRQLAGRPDVLLALELGGNNPIVVTGEVDAQKAAQVVSFSAFVSAGQRCTCARRVIYVDSPATDRQIKALVDNVKSRVVGLPGTDPTPQVGPIISSGAAEGLKQTYDQLIEIGCTPVLPFQVDPQRPNLVHPCLLDASNVDAAARRRMGELEWFGPMLVIQRAGDEAEAIAFASETCYGLAASLIGGDWQLFDQFVHRVGAGVVNWNRPTTGAAGALPFGGLGDSGNHRPAGYYAIDFCSDPIASLESESLADNDPWDVAK